MEWVEGITLDTTSRLDTLSFLFKNYFTNKERKYFLLFVGIDKYGVRIDNPPHRLNPFENYYKAVSNSSLASLARGSFSPVEKYPAVASIISDYFE